MGIYIKRSKNCAGFRPQWYMRFRDERGESKDMPTGIRIDGTPPASMSVKDKGSIAYERSKFKAEEYLRHFLEERKVKGAAQELTKALIEEKTGRELKYVRIGELYDSWRGFSRTREVSEDRRTISKSVFDRFKAFLKNRPSSANWQYLYEVTPEAATAFIYSLNATLAVSTVRGHLTLLSGAFRRLLPNGLPNPFADIKVGDGTAESKKIHRKPLTDAQLDKLYETAKKSMDATWLYPITVCAAETGMRIGDCCCLKWEDVYLTEGRLSVCTSKTGSLVDIPIFPDLRKVLESSLTEKDPSETYVFPKAASTYINNDSGVVHRGKLLFAEALFGDIQPQQQPTDVIDGTPKPPMTEQEVLAAIDASKFIGKKKALSKEVYSRYRHGQSYTRISHELGILRSRICTLLKNIEELTGEKIRPWAKADAKLLMLKMTRQSHKIGKNSASIYGWHSLRATFCYRAYQRGVPPELIRKVVGHKTFETTLNYYINPTWEQFKESWNGNTTITTAPSCQGIGQFVTALSTAQKKALLAELTSQLLSA